MGNHCPKAPENHLRTRRQPLDLDSRHVDSKSTHDITHYPTVGREKDQQSRWIKNLQAIKSPHADRADLYGVPQ